MGLFQKLNKYTPDARAIQAARVEAERVKETKTKRGKELSKGRKILASKRAARQRRIAETGHALGTGISQFRPPVEDFSFQEEALRQTFGHGDHIWGTEMEPVKINNDLHSSLSDAKDETASLFGFG